MSEPTNRPRRSVLYVPAINARAIAKSRSLDTDTLIFDLEDAVAPSMKAAARANLVEAFASAPFACETVIRVNAPGTPDHEPDLSTVASCRPDAVLVPKVDSAAQLATFFASAAARQMPAGIGLWAMIETAASLIGLDTLVAAGLAGAPKLDCMVVGTNDIAKETGVFTGDGRALLLPWLMNIVLVAKRHRVCVLDGVWNDFGDTDGFDAEVRQSVKMAFDGKTLIHPTQVEPANRLFAPAPDAVADARTIVEAFGLPEHAGAGVINLAGRMVERLHLEQAQRLLDIHEAIQARAGRT